MLLHIINLFSSQLLGIVLQNMIYCLICIDFLVINLYILKEVLHVKFTFRLFFYAVFNLINQLLFVELRYFFKLHRIDSRWWIRPAFIREGTELRVLPRIYRLPWRLKLLWALFFRITLRFYTHMSNIRGSWFLDTFNILGFKLFFAEIRSCL